MKRILALLLLAVVPLGAQDIGWTIESYDVEYNINADRTVSVVENIVVDFANLQRRGIFREIEVVYRKRVGGSLQLAAQKTRSEISDVRVTDQNGRELTTRVTGGDFINIRIGDENIYLTGVQRYRIHYRIDNALGFYDTHDELYWQVTGTDWPVPIRSASATIVLPNGGSPDAEGWGAWCYSGNHDSSDGTNCSAEMTGAGRYQYSVGNINPGEGFTVVAGFPKELITAPTWIDNAKDFLGTFWPIGLPFMVFGMMLKRWKKVGRDPPKGSVVPNWRAPKDLPAGLAGTLFDRSADMDDIVAILLGLSVRGFVRIKEVESDGLLSGVDENSFTGKALKALGLTDTDWELERLQLEKELELSSHEQLVLAGVFGAASVKRMSDLHHEFYKELPAIKEVLYDELVSRGFYRRKPNDVITRYIILGLVIMFGGVMIAIPTGNFVLVGGVMISALIILIFAPFMPARTVKGAARWSQLRGLEEYIRRAEKLELEMRQAPDKTTELFETLLPYAVALNVSDIWVKEFASVLEAQPPTWYVGSHPGRFDAGSFSQSINDFQTATTRTLGSSPGSSSGSGGGGGFGGGGSVGGGGGGGGGGSW